MVRKRGKASLKIKRKHPAKSHSKQSAKKRKVVKSKSNKARPVTKKAKRFSQLFSKPSLEVEMKRPPHELEEEFFVPSPIHRGKYRIPLGVRFLIGYLIFLSVLYVISFLYGITFPTTILFGKLITGARAMVINVILVGLIFLMIYGFWKRKAFTFDLSIGFFSFTALNAVISVMLFSSIEHPAIKKLLLLSFVSLIFMNIVIIWYILHERKYFYSERFKDRPFHKRDKVFLYILVTFWTVALLVGVTLGIQFYKDTTKMIDKTLMELRGDYYSGSILCDKKSGPEKDVCKLVVATAMSSKQRPYPELVGVCNSIESDFYQFTCMRSISG